MTETFVPLRERDFEDAPRNGIPLSARQVDPPPAAKEVKPAAKAPQVLINPDGTPTAIGWRKIGERFREEMPVKQRPGRGTAKFDYITARQVAERLDGVVGPGNWQTCFRVLDAEKVVVECTLTLYSVSKCDVGYSNNPDADHESEPFKAAYSDAFKRAAVQWGIGRFLYGDT